VPALAHAKTRRREGGRQAKPFACAHALVQARARTAESGHVRRFSSRPSRLRVRPFTPRTGFGSRKGGGRQSCSPVCPRPSPGSRENRGIRSRPPLFFAPFAASREAFRASYRLWLTGRGAGGAKHFFSASRETRRFHGCRYLGKGIRGVPRIPPPLLRRVRCPFAPRKFVVRHFHPTPNFHPKRKNRNDNVL